MFYLPSSGSIFAAFLHGKRSSPPKPILIGITLPVYPYFASEGWLGFAIGAILCYLVELSRK